MRKPFITICMLSALSALPAMSWCPAAHAGNSNVETALQSYGDLSMFYQALLNTGVINELKENEHYTIFAPTNVALNQIQPQTYPCFYAVECRPQIAALLRNHIVEGEHDLKNLVTYGSGIRTLGNHVAYVNEPFMHDYTVDDHNILSTTEVGGNYIYRIDGVITTPQELSQFQTVRYMDTPNITTEQTTVRRTYVSPSTASPAYPAGNMVPMQVAPDNATQTTTITHTYTTDQ